MTRDDAPGGVHGPTPTRHRVSVPSSMQARLLAIILLCVLPLGGIAATLARRNYQALSAQGTRRTESALFGFVADQQVAVQEAARSLAVLGAMPGLGDPAECPSLAALALRLMAGRAVGILVRTGGGDGTIVCRAGSDVPLVHDDRPVRLENGARLFDLMRAAGGIFAFPLRVTVSDAAGGADPVAPAGADRTLSIDALIAIERPPASARVGAFDRGTIWIRDAHGVHYLAGRTGGVPPSDAVLARLHGDRPVLATDEVGRLHTYASGGLPDGSTVVAGDRATDEEQRASALLVRSVIAIAVLLLVGLLVVMVGAYLTVSAPVLALARRVDRWREGGTFDGANLRFMPSELVVLSDVFAHAVDAIGERERQLERAAAEQELLIKEIHHRVKNNLQIIASLLNLQASRIRAPEAKAEFGAARDRVRALATLHRHLYAEGGLHAIAMRPFLLELCEQLFQAMGERSGSRIRLDIEAPDLDMPSDQAVPLALVVTEAVSNAVKYAFPGGRSGRIAVRLRRLGGDEIELTIEDDGVGIPAGRAETESGIRDGLGIQLIRGFSRQLGATLTVTEHEGTCYRLLLTVRSSTGPATASGARGSASVG